MHFELERAFFPSINAPQQALTAAFEAVHAHLKLLGALPEPQVTRRATSHPGWAPWLHSPVDLCADVHRRLPCTAGARAACGGGGRLAAGLHAAECGSRLRREGRGVQLHARLSLLPFRSL